MLKNYITIAYRNLNRHRAYTAINVFGLAVGLACCLLIVMYARHELSYDTFHENADRITRLVRQRSAYTAAPMGPALAAQMPGVRQATRLNVYEDVVVRGVADQRFVEAVAAVDSNFFDTFSFELLRGSTESALNAPDALILSESAARKYFGDSDPMGQTLTLEDDEPVGLRVTGVMRDMPLNAHFRFDMLASFAVVEQSSTRLANWDTNWLFTYLLMEEGADVLAIERALPSFFERNTGEARADMRIQPIRDVRLRSAHLELDIAPQGSIAYVVAFSAIAMLVLLIACINFINLATARSARRAREVGVRKVLGARRRQLFAQFMGESLLLTTVSLLLAIVIAALALPSFGALTGASLSLSARDVPAIVALVTLLAIIVGIVAGSYPAVFLSAFSPRDTLKGTQTSPARGGRLRKVLVVSQFAVSTFLIVATLIVQRQLDYVRDAQLGLELEQLVALPTGDAPTGDSEAWFERLKTAFSQHAGVSAVAATGSVPGRGVSDFLYRPEGLPGSTDDLPGWDTYFVDPDFAHALQLNVVQGTGFSSEGPQTEPQFILNESAVANIVEDLGPEWQSPIGKQIDFYLPGAEGWRVFRSGTIVAVVEDFHYRSLREDIGPLVMQQFPDAFETVLAKISTDDIAGTLAFLEDAWNAAGIEQPFAYYFVDESFAQLYENDARLGRLFGFLAALTILIACLGLFGLAAFMAERRTKEIGIRKTLGASTAGIALLLSREFATLVGVAFVVGAPVAYIVMRSWLEGFAYRANPTVATFIAAAVSVAFITLGTVSYQAIRAASADPVRALRYQ